MTMTYKQSLDVDSGARCQMGLELRNIDSGMRCQMSLELRNVDSGMRCQIG